MNTNTFVMYNLLGYIIWPNNINMKSVDTIVHDMVYDPITGTARCSHRVDNEFFEKAKIAIEDNPIVVNGLVNTSGLSFNVSYVDSDGAFDPNAVIFGGLSTIQWIETYLASWGPSITSATGFTTSVTITFIDNGGSAAAATGGGLFFGIPNNNPIITACINVPSSYDLINVTDVTTTSRTSSFFIQSSLRFFEFQTGMSFGVSWTDPDINITVNTFYIKAGSVYDYTDSFTNGSSLISFKGVIVHEFHHGMGFIEQIFNSTSDGTIFTAHLFQTANVPTSVTEYNDGTRDRIGSETDVILNFPYGNIYISDGTYSTQIDNNTTSHLLETVSGTNGLMEPVAIQGGTEWSVNDAFGLKIVGWDNALSCVTCDTLVTMANGLMRSIKDISRGDEVFGFNNIIHKVAKVNKSKVGPNLFVDVGVFSVGSIDGINPTSQLMITQAHPIIYDNKRKPASCFVNFPNVKMNRQQVKDIIPSENGNYYLYDLQFETPGSYYANSVLIQSRSPNSFRTPLAKELYFNPELYTGKQYDDNEPGYEHVFDPEIIM